MVASVFFEKKDAIVTAVLPGNFDAAELLAKRRVGINKQDDIGRLPSRIFRLSARLNGKAHRDARIISLM